MEGNAREIANQLSLRDFKCSDLINAFLDLPVKRWKEVCWPISLHKNSVPSEKIIH